MWATVYELEIYARHYRQQHEKEAQEYRLAREYDTMLAWQRTLHRALAWVGRRMARWGVRLWVRYGDATPYRRPALSASLPRGATSGR